MNKRVLAERLLTQGDIWVVFDPKQADVPGHLDKRSDISFQYGHNMVIPIPDLFINNDGISATLRFGSRSIKTFVPWNAVKAIHNDKNMGWSWFEQAPVERKKPELRLIKGGKK